MPYGNGVAYYGGGISQARNPTTSTQLNESTQKLFKAIDDENLEEFKQALEEADVNAFDRGYTPLMTIVINLSSIEEEEEKKYHSMIRLLLLHRNINVNIREQNNNNTALHLAMCFQQKKTLQLLLSHPNIDTILANKHHQSPSEYARQNRAGHLIIEIQKAQGGRQLLDALSNGNIYQAKRLLNQELNPNCWKRTYNEEIETPLSLICLQGITPDNKEVLTKLLKHKELDFSQIKPIQNIEQNPRLKKIIEQAITERLTNAINRRDLDDVKKLVEDNCFINHAIVTAAFESIERIKDYLNEKFPANTNNIPKDFEGFVEELVEELEKTKIRLGEKEQELANKTSRISQLKRDLAQVRQEKAAQQDELIQYKRIVCGRANDTVEISQLKKDLKQVREERDRLLSENRQLPANSLNNKNKKSSKTISPGKKQSNCASASFLLSGAFAVGACLAVLYD